MNKDRETNRTTAVIIEDVQDAIDNLKDLLSTFIDDVELIGTARNVVDGAKLVKRTQPEILFLDIEMPDGTGFDLLDLLPDTFNGQIIFTTGSEQYAIQAFRYAAVDYLLKPIDPDELMEAVKRVQQTPHDLRFRKQVLLDNEKLDSPDKLVLHTQDELRIVHFQDIIRCKSYDNYCQFILGDGDRILVSRPLKEYDILLEPAGFIRVHQSHLVNINKIKSYVKKEGGYLLMQDGSHVPVAVRKKAMVMKLLQGIL
jgi:two-component system LytT family response regulator